MKEVSISKSELVYLYVDKGLSMKRVSLELGVSVGKVHKMLHEYEVPIRSANCGVLSDEGRAKIVLALKSRKGKHMSQETKDKISNARKLKTYIGHKKKRKDGYVCLYIPTHPHANKEGYVMEHVYLMEQSIGRLLTPEECVHHINRVRNDNRIENLQLMTKHDHMSLHSKERHKNHQINYRTIKVVNLDTNEIFNSIKDAAKKYKVSANKISAVCKGECSMCGGYHWKYA